MLLSQALVMQLVVVVAWRCAMIIRRRLLLLLLFSLLCCLKSLDRLFLLPLSKEQLHMMMYELSLSINSLSVSYLSSPPLTSGQQWVVLLFAKIPQQR